MRSTRQDRATPTKIDPTSFEASLPTQRVLRRRPPCPTSVFAHPSSHCWSASRSAFGFYKNNPSAASDRPSCFATPLLWVPTGAAIKSNSGSGRPKVQAHSGWLRHPAGGPSAPIKQRPPTSGLWVQKLRYRCPGGANAVCKSDSSPHYLRAIAPGHDRGTRVLGNLGGSKFASTLRWVTLSACRVLMTAYGCSDGNKVVANCAQWPLARNTQVRPTKGSAYPRHTTTHASGPVGLRTRAPAGRVIRGVGSITRAA